MKIPFYGTKRENLHLKKKIIYAINNSLKHGNSLQGPEVKLLENKISNLVGKKYAVAVGSCTDALFFALKSIGIKSGDEVLVT